MVAGLVIGSVTALPEDVSGLLHASLAEGYDFMERLVRDWEEGVNRFDAMGEVLLEARLDGRLLAMGGLNQDPYTDDPTVGRIRHVYVHPDARGSGVGRQVVLALVENARTTFQRVRLRGVPPRAPAFYIALGFSAATEENATHEIRF